MLLDNIFCSQKSCQEPKAKADRRMMTESVGNNRATLASASPGIAILPVTTSTPIAMLPVLDGKVGRVHYREGECRIHGAPLYIMLLDQSLPRFYIVFPSPCRPYAAYADTRIKVLPTSARRYRADLRSIEHSGHAHCEETTHMQAQAVVLRIPPPSAANSAR